jgi:ubiquinone/menaquinone biosynthesis methyltransferase
MMKSQFNLNVYDYIHQPEGKLAFNKQLFSHIAPKYDMVNRILSFGRDTVWKKQLVDELPTFTAEHAETAEKKQKLNAANFAVSAVSSYIPVCLDIACGTGDITFRLAAKYPQSRIVGIDITEEMLNIARSFDESRATNHESRVMFEISDMCRMSFADDSFDIVTGGYALRNAPNLERALLEIQRVMRPGATAAFLDLSKSSNRFVQAVQDLLLRLWGGLWGILLHCNPQLYTYIAVSLRQFPDSTALKQLISRLGFTDIRSRKHFFGFTETIFFQKPSQH